MGSNNKLYIDLLSVFLWCSFFVLFTNQDDLVVDESSKDLEALDVQFSLPFNIYIITTRPSSLERYSV